MSSAAPALDSAHLREIIRTQTEIAQLGIDLGSVMELVATRSQDLTDADGAIVELAEDDEMVYRASTGQAKKQLGLRLKREGSLSGLCVAEGQALRCDDSETDPRVDRDACRRVGLRSMVVTPLRFRETVVGVLKVFSRQPAAFNEQSLELLGLLSGMVAASMYHAGKLETSELFRCATQDPLTGLANRALFFDRLRREMSHSHRDSRRFAVLNLDMDGLKPINDNFGHRAGDAAIRTVAERVRNASRDIDVTARMGGDEFAVLLTGAGPDDAKALAHRLEALISTGFEFNDQRLALGASIGSAVFPDDGSEPDSLLDAADRAMYQVKRGRKPTPR